MELDKSRRCRQMGVFMKKYVSLFLVLAMMSAFVLSACGPQKKIRTPETALYYYDGIADLSEYLELPDYSSLTLDVNPEPTDEEVESYIANMLRSNPGVKKITDRPIAENDVVAITFVGTVEGVKADDCSYEDAEKLYECTVGAGNHVEGFEEALIGLMPGESVSVDLVFPENVRNEAYAGKAVNFAITTYEIREYYTPELTDDFVKGLALTDGETAVETVDAYRAYARKTVQKSNSERIRNNLDSYKWKLVSETATVKQYPQEEIDRYLQDNTAYYQKIAEQYGMAFADYLSAYGMTEEAFQELLQKDAEAYVRDCFVAEKIARDQDISFTEEEYKEMLEDLALDQSVENGQALVDQYGDGFMRMYFLTEKVVAYLKDQIAEVNVPAEESGEKE